MIGFLVRFSFRVTVCSVLLGSALAAVLASAADAQDTQLSISWEVRNRFRLFREERDFRLHVESGLGRSVLASEQALELQSDGRGWARNTVNRLCIDLQGRVSEPCTRDNVKESYLTPIDHPIVVRPWQERKRLSQACTASATARQPIESRQQQIRRLRR